jgi:hypothetical protein
MHVWSYITPTSPPHCISMLKISSEEDLAPKRRLQIGVPTDASERKNGFSNLSASKTEGKVQHPCIPTLAIWRIAMPIGLLLNFRYCFVDDIMLITVDEGDNLLRLATTPCTVIHAIGHSATGETHLKRQDLILEEKNVAEGTPEEEKICLGWTFNTRRLTVALPSHKYEAWDNQVKNIISAKSIKFKLLESILGRLKNVAIIVVMFGHFLNNI